jgi:uncharacterized protein (TIGR02118 family)
MIKLIYCIKRLPSISEEEFHKYWREQHGPLVQKCAGPLRIARYVQSHTIPDTEKAALNKGFQKNRGTSEPYDGAAELWFESVEDFLEGGRDPEGAKAVQALYEDEKNFIDFSRSSIFFVEEHELIRN